MTTSSPIARATSTSATFVTPQSQVIDEGHAARREVAQPRLGQAVALGQARGNVADRIGAERAAAR